MQAAFATHALEATTIITAGGVSGLRHGA
jgi:hypothetical protein